MKDFYEFAGNHPFLTFCLVYCILYFPSAMLNRWIRSWNIKNAGWPPVYLDADGDAIKKEEQQ